MKWGKTVGAFFFFTGERENKNANEEKALSWSRDLGPFRRTVGTAREQVIGL